jgi:hypothetical protein
MFTFIIKICGVIGFLMIISAVLNAVNLMNKVLFTIGQIDIRLGICVLIFAGGWGLFKVKVTS